MYNRIEIIRILQRTHTLFYKFFSVGTPIFVEDGSIGTAAVALDKTAKKVLYYWEKSFWDSRTDYERAFIICHELLHITLSQLIRGKDLPYKKIFNYAADVVVNNMLVEDFGFDSSKITNWDKLATFDTVFPADKYPNLDRTHCFEYYYQLLVDNAEKIEVESIDNHEMFGDTDLSDSIDVDWDSIQSDISGEEKQHAKGPGIGEGNQDIQVEKTYSRECKGWLKAIKKWKEDFGDTDTSQWIKPNRRVQSLPDGIFLPSMEEYEDLKRRPEVWIFMDVSMSCIRMVPDFIKAARSIPDSFKKKYFTFDVKVRSVDIDNLQYSAGGGTTIQPIENELLKANRYPDHVFIVTDGEFLSINVKHPDRWNFFLDGLSMTQYLPSGSHHYILKDIIK